MFTLWYRLLILVCKLLLEHGQPRDVVKSLVPQHNNLVFFEVNAKSFHQVCNLHCIHLNSLNTLSKRSLVYCWIPQLENQGLTSSLIACQLSLQIQHYCQMKVVQVLYYNYPLAYNS